MANSEESSPLLTNQSHQVDSNDQRQPNHDENHKKSTIETPIPNAPPPAAADMKQPPQPPAVAAGFYHHLHHGWTADGLPLANGGDVMGEPLPKAQWDSGLFACLGRNDEFCSSDLEVCLLGSMAPCVVYGSNVERLGAAPGTFANHCLPYSGLYLLGNAFFGWNCMAPWFSYPTRTTIRRRFNLEGNWDGMSKSCGGCCDLDEEQAEQAEMACDFATHVFCHPCALCQEGREVRRRLTHPGFHAHPHTHPTIVMIPPGEQTMGA